MKDAPPPYSAAQNYQNQPQFQQKSSNFNPQMNPGMGQPQMMAQQYQRNPNSDRGRGSRGGQRGGRGGFNQGPPVQQQMHQGNQGPAENTGETNRGRGNS